MNIVWLNGALLPAGNARIDPTDRGFTLGDGVFETMRAEAGLPLHASLHFARLRAGAAMLGINVPWSDDELLDAVRHVAHANDLVAAALRVTLTRGPAPRGVLPAPNGAPTLLITAGPLPALPPPARVIVSALTRRNEHSPLSRIKSLNYLDSILARQEAQTAGADDALLLNGRGDLAEATSSNVFLRLEGKWVTPRIADGALPGVARHLLLHAGFAVEACISADSLGRAEMGFMTNSLARRDIGSLDGRELDLVVKEGLLF